MKSQILLLGGLALALGGCAGHQGSTASNAGNTISVATGDQIVDFGRGEAWHGPAVDEVGDPLLAPPPGEVSRTEALGGTATERGTARGSASSARGADVYTDFGRGEAWHGPMVDEVGDPLLPVPPGT